MTAHWTVRRHWLQAKTSLPGLVLSFIACFILLVIAPWVLCDYRVTNF